MKQHHLIANFLKVSIFTTVLFGGLLAQSYATTLFSNTIMKMNIEFSATDATESITQKASMTVHDDQRSSIAFGDHQLDIKTSFISWEDDAKEHEQVLAEIIVQKLNEAGQYQIIHQPSLLILRNEWAEITIDPENGEESIELKMQYEDFEPVQDDNASLFEPEWLNWQEKSAQEEIDIC